jgi:uncharacterized protein (DUF1501 family)
MGEERRPVHPGLSRRQLFRLTAAAGLVTAIGIRRPPAAFAAPAGTENVLVVVSLRGGFDALSAVVPLGDAHYARARPRIAVPASAAKKVDAMFGLHPAMTAVYPWWDSGRLAAVHAVGQDDPTRSHFEAMAAMERAAPGSSLHTGWLDRAIALSGSTNAFTGAQVGDAGLPASLYGQAPKMSLTSVEGLSVKGDPEQVPLSSWTKALTGLNAKAPVTVREPMANALAAAGRVESMPETRSAEDLGYPDTSFGRAVHDVARLISAGVGLRYVTVEFGNWDMHENVGTVEGGRMLSQLTELSEALAAFAAELGPGLDRVTVATISEFGRRVRQNGSGGLDHGHGTAMLLLGGGVRGGSVYGRWPGLAPDRLDSGDLAVTTDYRDVLGEILTRRCGVDSLEPVFPGLRHRPPGAISA